MQTVAERKKSTDSWARFASHIYNANENPADSKRSTVGSGTQRAGTWLCTHRSFTKGRSTFSRSTENGPAFP